MTRLLSALVALLAAAAIRAADVAVPPYERLVLPNGTTLLLMAQHEVPLISFQAMLRGGASCDPEDRSGTASLLASLLEKGAGTRNALELADAVDRVGGRIHTYAERELIAASGTFLARDQALMVELLSDMLMRPRLEQAQFEKVRERQIELIRAAKDSDLDALVSVYGEAALLGRHPYGRAVNGSEASLARIDIDDVRSFYSQHAGADRLIVSVAGDFQPRAMKQLLTRAFSGWRRSERGLPAIEVPAPATARRVLLIDAPQSTQSYFWMGSIGVAKADSRRAALDTVNAEFGGRYLSMLNNELRVRSGLTYGARSRFQRFARSGVWSIASFTRADTTASAIDLAFDVLQRLHRDPLSEAQLAGGRRYIAGQFPLALETAGDWADMLATLELYELDRSYVEDYLPAVARVDAAAARNVIASVFPRAERMQLVVIGPAAAIRDALRKYGPLTEMKLSDPEFTPLARPLATRAWDMGAWGWREDFYPKSQAPAPSPKSSRTVTPVTSTKLRVPDNALPTMRR